MATNTMSDLSKQFELAVYDFVKRLDPRAEVLLDHRVLDRDTNKLRQVDAWINAKIGGHIPYSVYVSCKKHGRKLDVTHIGSFLDEIRSFGANLGVIYSSAGFSRDAIEKVKKNGHACCQLYEGQPTEKPQSFVLRAYSCQPRIEISLMDCVELEGVNTWNDLFDIRVGDGESPPTVLDKIAESVKEDELEAAKRIKKEELFPAPWETTMVFNTVGDPRIQIPVKIVGRWKKFVAKLEAHLLDGSYCFTSDSFVGRQYSPTLDMQSEHPGPDWEEVDDDFPFPDKRLVMIRRGRKVKEAIREQLGASPLQGC